MALVPYLIEFPSKGNSTTTKVVHGQKALKEHKGAALISTLRKGKWTPPLSGGYEDFATWEK